MFHFRAFPSYGYFIHRMIRDSSSRWFPNSDTRGSMLMYSSPQLFAVSRVLRRLLMPRHSPYALLSLNFALFARSASQCSEFLLPQKLSINSLRLHNLSSLACFSLFLWLKLFYKFRLCFGNNCSFNFTHAIPVKLRVYSLSLPCILCSRYLFVLLIRFSMNFE